jgi:hypothetical protein
VAVTDFDELIVNSQSRLPEQAPPQPVNLAPCAGVALSLIELPAEYG